MQKHKIGEKVKKAVKENKPLGAFNPVLRERDMSRDASESGAYGINDFLPGESNEYQQNG